MQTHPFGGGRPRVPERRCAEAIFYVRRTGCQWEARNQTELCAKSTAHDRCHEGVEADVCLHLWQAGGAQFDALKGIEWDWLSMDGAMTKAPLGGKKPGPRPTDRAKGGVKRRLVTEGPGVPIGRAVAGANRQDMKRVRSPLASRVVKRPAPTPAQPQGLCLDKA